MLGKVIIENGVKKIVALTADTGVGAPVGSYLYLEKKSNPQGYLYCDGSTFDETAYPALFQYLGTNVLPDWRELGAKGAEKNTTLIFDSTETDPRTGQAGTQNHDVFTQGEFKDDQLQDHGHKIRCGTVNPPTGIMDTTNGSDDYRNNSVQDVVNARAGTVTRGKSRAVFVYIKATSGLTENQQENVLNTINENNSYSTEETATGAKWIDGKPIYRKVLSAELPSGTGYFDIGAVNIPNLSLIVNAQVNRIVGSGYQVMNTGVVLYNGHIEIEQIYTGAASTCLVILEYTKTTD